VVQLGDRVDIHDLAFRDGQVVVTMITQGPQDAMCCPTLHVARHFTVQGSKLAAAGETVLSPPPAIVGPVWQWVRTFYNDDSKILPPKPDAYTVTFDAGGTLNVRADCNQKGGTYLLKDQGITIEVTHSTMAMCPGDSLEDRFVRDLTGAAGWFLKDGDLYLDLKYDTGTMRLTRQK
jgi:heat shock protein HslJ